MQCQHETPVLEIHGPRLIVLSNLTDPSVPRSYLTIKFSWMTNIWLLKKLSTLWQTTPAGWVHYFSLPCLPEGSSVSSFLFMLGNSLEAPCFKNNPLAATPGDGWIAGANGCTGLMSVEVAFCLESSAAGCCVFFFLLLFGKNFMHDVWRCKMFEKRSLEWIASSNLARTWKKPLIPWLCLTPGLSPEIGTSWVHDCNPQTMVFPANPCSFVLASQTYKKLCKINDQCCLIPSWANSLHFNNFGQTSQQSKGTSAKCNSIYPDNVNSLFPHLPVANISSK